MATDKITVLIVEDDPIIAADLSYLMKDFGYSPFPVVNNGTDALLLLNNIIPDLILIDVTLEGEMDGIDLAAEVKKSHNLPIIFLTALYDRKTIDRIKATQPSAYLVKPIQEHNLQTSIELALYNHSHQHFTDGQDIPPEEFLSDKHFFIKVRNQLRKISLEDIRVLEAHDNYSFVHTKGEKHIINSTLKSLESKLNPRQFARIHRSFMVNLMHIEKIEEDIVVIDNFSIPIGKTYKEELMRKIQLL